MRILGGEKRLKFYQTFLGRTLPFLIESKRDGLNGMLKGISSNYLPVLVDVGDDLKNRIVDVKIEKIVKDQLFGTVTP